MKSIEDKLKLMLNNAISYAYERRTNFRGAYIKIYEEILSRFAELEKQVESLKCCGNCKHEERKMFYNDFLYCRKCDNNSNWQSDITREERK